MAGFACADAKASQSKILTSKGAEVSNLSVERVGGGKSSSKIKCSNAVLLSPECWGSEGSLGAFRGRFDRGWMLASDRLRLRDDGGVVMAFDSLPEPGGGEGDVGWGGVDVNNSA